MRIYTACSMALVEEEIFSHFSLSPEILMEHAGFMMAERIETFCCTHGIESVAVLCGNGHNGGDGYVIARALHLRGRCLSLFAAEGNAKPLTLANRRRCESLDIVCRPLQEFKPNSTAAVVDALFGIGLNRPLSEKPWRELFSRIGQSNAAVIAVDTPSGLFENRLPENPILPADLTLTVEYPKLEFFTPNNRCFCGTIETVSAAFPPTDAVAADAHLASAAVPEIDASLFDHKYTKGHAALWAGSRSFPGAALLASRAALKSGTGLLTLHCDSPIAETVLQQEPAIILASNEATDETEKITAWGCGCGWGKSLDRLPILKKFINTPIPRVLDADALNLFAEHFPRERFADGAVLTPHPGEWKRLSPDSSSFYDNLRRFAAEKNCTIVYKSSFSVVVSPEREITVFDNPVPELGTAGSGDVLTGILLAFLARGLQPYRAAVEAVALHNFAGQAAARNGVFTASELIETAASLLKRPHTKEPAAL